MIRRPLLTTLTATALYAGVLVGTASAESHRLRVTLVTGQQLTVTADVPPGTPPDQVQIPGLPAPVNKIEDLGAVPTPTPTPTATKPAAKATPAKPDRTPTPTATGTPDRAANKGGSDKSAADKRKRAATEHGSKHASHGAGGDTRGGANVDSGVGHVKVPAEKAKRKHKRAHGDGGDGGAGAAGGGAPAGGTGGGLPSTTNPTFTVVPAATAKIGIPNFFIERFRIPPFLLPIYQAAGTQYGVRWELLAAINEIETDYGRNLNVSTAGAVGWMQFLPETWDTYGVDGNEDGVKDPFNPVDAIFAAARYLRAAGADKDIRGAVFAYNHADWYVDSVLLRARLIGGLPSNLVGSLTGLTEGHFPVHAKATYADGLSRRDLHKKRQGNRALVVESSAHRRGINIYARAGAPVVAVNDAKVLRVGHTQRLGQFVQIQDVYGNTYTYGRLAKIEKRFAAPKPHRATAGEIERELSLPKRDARPTAPASDTTRAATKAPPRRVVRKAAPAPRHKARPSRAVVTKERLFAHPRRDAAAAAGGAQQVVHRSGRIDGTKSVPADIVRMFGLRRGQIVIKKLRPGASVPAGTLLGRIGHNGSARAPHMLFEIRPAGRGAPRVDPKPILDGWKLLESTAVYRAKGLNPFTGPDAATPSVGQILLMSKETLQERVLADPRIQIYGCGRRDIRAGQIDRRVLATLEFLVASGFDPTVSALECGHSYLTASGNVSEHSSGNAVDIAKVNGIPIVGHQGPGSITELVIQRLLTLQGTMVPHQIISLMSFDGAPNTLAMADHADHIHVGFQPYYGTNSKVAKQINAILKPKQWIKLIDRLGEISNPRVRLQPSKYAVKTTRPATRVRKGE